MSRQRRPDPREYTAVVHWVTDEDDTKNDYYIAFSPEFGFCACSGPGDTEAEALENLRANLVHVMDYYTETGREIPTPSYQDFDTGEIVVGERPELTKRRRQ